MAELFSYQQAADWLDPTGQLGITKRTIERLVQSGQLERIKLGRAPAVRKADVEALTAPKRVNRVPLLPVTVPPPCGASRQSRRTSETRQIMQGINDKAAKRRMQDIRDSLHKEWKRKGL